MPFTENDGPESDAPLDEALAWFVRLRDDGASASERAAFAAWRAVRSENAAAYARVEKLWNSPAFAEALSRFPVSAPPARQRPRRWFGFRALAASVLLLMSAWGLATSGLLDRWRADYATAVGERRRVELADGSVATLNTDSALILAFGPERRGVRLLAGEAYFEVKADSARPFLVETGNATIRVVGTRFAVRTGTRTSVTVDSGSVACTNGKGDSLRVTAGQEASISETAVTLSDTVDTGHRLAWVQGRLIFRDQPLAEVLAELDRYHPGALVIAGARLAETRITGSYKLDDPAAVADALATVTGARLTRLSPYLTVFR